MRQCETTDRRRFRQPLMFLIAVAIAASGWCDDLDRHLVFLSTFDDVTDVNLFGADHDAGWIYTADSTRRENVLVMNRCSGAGIAKDQGHLGDCIHFREKIPKALFYQASANLDYPRHDWSGTFSFWIKPDYSQIGSEPCFPFQLTDGDWSRGGAYVRIDSEGKRPSLELGVVSASHSATRIDGPLLAAASRRYVMVTDTPTNENAWMLVTISIEHANVLESHNRAADCSRATFYINGNRVATVQAPLQLDWICPSASGKTPDAAMFLGLDYVGGIDDLRVYEPAIDRDVIKKLYRHRPAHYVKSHDES